MKQAVVIENPDSNLRHCLATQSPPNGGSLHEVLKTSTHKSLIWGHLGVRGMFCHLVPVAYVKMSASSAIPNSLAAYWPFVSDTSIKMERSNHCFLILSPTCGQAVDFSFKICPTSPFRSCCHCYTSQALLILLLDQRPSLSETAALFFSLSYEETSHGSQMFSI